MTDAQRKRLNAICGDLSRQIRLTPQGQYVNADKCSTGTPLDKDSWRWMFCGTYLGWRVLPAIEGSGFIMLGGSSKRLDVDAASEVMLMMEAFGNDRDVKFTDPELEQMEAAP